MVEEIRAAGGAVFGITSEPHSLASEAESAWGLTFPIIGDPHHEIRKELKMRGWLDVFYNEDYGHLRERDWADHPNGYFQPAVIALDKTKRVLYRWRCVPKYSNMSGAGARPEARYTWDRMQTLIAASNAAEQGDASMVTMDAPLDDDPVMGAAELSWPMFLIMMTAHGWFLRPRAFPLLRDGGKASVTPKQAFRRAKIFAGLWVLALVALPFKWVGIAFLVYVLALLPGLLEIHRQFQDEAASV